MILWTLMMWKITSNEGVLWDVSCGLEWSRMKELLIAKWHFLTPWSFRTFQNSTGFSAPIFIILLVHIYFPCLKLPCPSNLPFGFLFWGCALGMLLHVLCLLQVQMLCALLWAEAVCWIQGLDSISAISLLLPLLEGNRGKKGIDSCTESLFALKYTD